LEGSKTIKEQIGFLIQLQGIDAEIYELNREKSQVPYKFKAMDDELEIKKVALKEVEDKLKSLQLKLKDKEIALQQKEEQVKKLQLQLYQIKTNKEYTAMLTEIEGIKADNSILEEEIIRLMEEIDSVKIKIVEEKKIFEENVQQINKEKEKINNRIKEIDSRLAELNTERERIVPNIEKKILARYDRVLKNRDGLAMVKVIDGACGGCHMNLPPQVISDVKMREDIVVCGSCSRILYLDENAEIN